MYTESKAPVQGNKYYLKSFYIIIQSNQSKINITKDLIN